MQKHGDTPNITLLRCSWCRHETLWRLEKTEIGAEVLMDANGPDSAWVRGSDGIERLSIQATRVYRRGKDARRRVLSQVEPRHHARYRDLDKKVAPLRLMHYASDVPDWVPGPREPLSGTLRRRCPLKTCPSHGLGGASVVAFAGTGVTGTVITAASSDTLLSVDVAIAASAALGPRSFSVLTPRGPVFSPAGLVFTVRDPRLLSVADPDPGSRLAVAPGQPGPSVQYSATYVTTLRFLRPATAVGPSEIVMPVNLSGLQLRTSPVAGTSARVSYDWKVESPQMRSTPLFQSSAVAELGKTGEVTGSIPAASFDLTELGVVRLKDDIATRFVLPPVAESLAAVDFTITFTLSGERSVTNAVAQPVSPADGEQLSSFAPRLVWRQPNETVAYHVQVVPLFGDGPGIDLIIGNASLVSQSAFQVRAPLLGTGNYVLLPGATYTWRVRVCVLASSCADTDSNAWTGWSALWRFTTPAASSSSITLAPPAAGANPPALRWSDANLNIFYYEVQLSADADFGAGPRGPIAAVQSQLLHGGLTTPRLSFTPRDALPPGTYHWRVRPRLQATPLGSAGPGVAWTPTATFTLP